MSKSIKQAIDEFLYTYLESTLANLNLEAQQYKITAFSVHAWLWFWDMSI